MQIEADINKFVDQNEEKTASILMRLKSVANSIRFRSSLGLHLGDDRISSYHQRIVC